MALNLFQRYLESANAKGGGDDLEKLQIEGGRPLRGEVRVHGAKNAALPILAATVLASGIHVIENVPDLLDIRVMVRILEQLGCVVTRDAETMTIDTRGIHSTQIPELLMRQMRSSIFLAGPLLARFGEVELFQPGGCAIGERKIDLHVEGLCTLGAQLRLAPASFRFEAVRLSGAEVRLAYPSVGATENVMMAAVLASGTTTISNAAREPEIEDLQRFLCAMGANVSGAGTPTIYVEGVDELHPPRDAYCIMPDRIVAGTYLCAAMATRGDLTVRAMRPEQVQPLLDLFVHMGAIVHQQSDAVHVAMDHRPRANIFLDTGPYPEFPTDLQAQLMVLLAVSEGHSRIREQVFERRYQHVPQLQKMHATIFLQGDSAHIQGVRRLHGAEVAATDLRAGAALVLAGLVATGITTITDVQHIDRGYARIEDAYRALGASIWRVDDAINPTVDVSASIS